MMLPAPRAIVPGGGAVDARAHRHAAPRLPLRLHRLQRLLRRRRACCRHAQHRCVELSKRTQQHDEDVLD
eukprot:1319920-Rhodomonas_salina.3